MKKKNILIIGLGNIGSKRLNILIKNKIYNKIYIFDKIKLKRLYSNFVPDEQFYCIRGSMKGSGEKLVNKPVSVYGQTEVTTDLYSAREKSK